MANLKYGNTNGEDYNKGIFELHLGIIANVIEHRGGNISKAQAIEEYRSIIKKEERQNKIYKMPLIGKMIYNNKIHSYAKKSEMYRLILSLINDFKCELLTNEHIEWVLNNIDSVYDKCYKEYYNEMLGGKPLTKGNEL